MDSFELFGIYKPNICERLSLFSNQTKTHLNNQVPGEDLPRPRSASFNISRNKRRTYSHVSGLMFITEIFKIINRLLQTLQATPIIRFDYFSLILLFKCRHNSISMSFCSVALQPEPSTQGHPVKQN